MVMATLIKVGSAESVTYTLFRLRMGPSYPTIMANLALTMRLVEIEFKQQECALSKYPIL